jgi:hypothetical protein
VFGYIVCEALQSYDKYKDAFPHTKTQRRMEVKSRYEEQWIAEMTTKQADGDNETPIPPKAKTNHSLGVY